MYQVRVNFKEMSGDEIRHFEVDDFFTTKKEVVRFIAEIIGEMQSVIADEIHAKTDSTLYRDSKGWRARVWYS